MKAPSQQTIDAERQAIRAAKLSGSVGTARSAVTSSVGWAHVFNHEDAEFGEVLEVLRTAEAAIADAYDAAVQLEILCRTKAVQHG